MSIIREHRIRKQALRQIAENMLIAARTAPKGKGRDTLEMCIIEGDSIARLSKQIKELGNQYDLSFFHRDAENILKAEVIVAIGTRIETLGLNEACQLCGFENCAAKEQYPETPCVFNTGDLNLAIGSAVALASDHRVDNRVMFTIGKALTSYGWFESDIKIAMGIPLSASSKNPFFDRK